MTLSALCRWGAGALLLAGACGGDDFAKPSGEGELLVSYDQVGANAGALLLSITGGPVDSVRAVNPSTELVEFSSPYPGTTLVVVTGELGIGALLRLRVPDVSQASHYSVEVLEVADKVTFSLIERSSHHLTISP